MQISQEQFFHLKKELTQAGFNLVEIHKIFIQLVLYFYKQLNHHEYQLMNHDEKKHIIGYHPKTSTFYLKKEPLLLFLSNKYQINTQDFFIGCKPSIESIKNKYFSSLVSDDLKYVNNLKNKIFSQTKSKTTQLDILKMNIINDEIDKFYPYISISNMIYTNNNLITETISVKNYPIYQQPFKIFENIIFKEFSYLLKHKKFDTINEINII